MFFQCLVLVVFKGILNGETQWLDGQHTSGNRVCWRGPGGQKREKARNKKSLTRSLNAGTHAQTCPGYPGSSSTKSSASQSQSS